MARTTQSCRLTVKRECTPQNQQKDEKRIEARRGHSDLSEKLSENEESKVTYRALSKTTQPLYTSWSLEVFHRRMHERHQIVYIHHFHKCTDVLRVLSYTVSSSLALRLQACQQYVSFVLNAVATIT